MSKPCLAYVELFKASICWSCRDPRRYISIAIAVSVILCMWVEGKESLNSSIVMVTVECWWTLKSAVRRISIGEPCAVSLGEQCFENSVESPLRISARNQKAKRMSSGLKRRYHHWKRALARALQSVVCWKQLCRFCPSVYSVSCGFGAGVD